MVRKSRQIRTAYHEVGHAIAAFHLGVKIRRLSIVADHEYWGHVLFGRFRFNEESWDSMRPALRDRFERRVIVSLSGRDGERLITGRYDHIGQSQDYRWALFFVSELVDSSEEAGACLRWLMIRARQLIRADFRRPGIDALATALLERKKISGVDAFAIFLDALKSAQLTDEDQKKNVEEV